MQRHLPVSEVFRKDLRPEAKNSYRRVRKVASGTRCPDCGLVFLDGVWKRGVAPGSKRVASKPCPACRQIRDDFPGGVLRLSGAFVSENRGEILKCVRNTERAELAEHPLERIYRTEELPEAIVLHSTSEHLVARIGKSLRDAFGGELQLRYGPEAEWVLARWHKS